MRMRMRLRWVRQRAAGRVRTVRKEQAVAIRVSHCTTTQTRSVTHALNANRSLHFGVAKQRKKKKTKTKTKKKRKKTSNERVKYRWQPAENDATYIYQAKLS